MKLKQLLTAALIGLALLATSAVTHSAPAHALPPDGPSPNTPGTYVEVWPTTVRHGDVLNFRVSGFPAGEVIHLKYDDGAASVCGSSAVHGACVIHTQVVPSSGVTVGSIVIPHDLPAGNHWIRFLASAPAPGTGGGVLGFSLHGQGGGYGNSNFTVVTGGSSGGGTASAGSGQAGGNASTPSGAGLVATTTEAGGVAEVAPQEESSAPEPKETPKLPAKASAELAESERADLEAAIVDGNLVLVTDPEYANEWMFLFAYPDDNATVAGDLAEDSAAGEPRELGWQQVANDGTLRYPVSETEPGAYRLAIVDADERLAGWTEFELADDAADLDAEDHTVTASAAESNATLGAGSNTAGAAVPWLGLGILAAAVAVSAAVLAVTLRQRRTDTGREPTKTGALEVPRA